MVEVTEPTDEALLDGFQRAAFGYTELLEGFVSNKTRRKFKAYLAYDKAAGKNAAKKGR